MIGQATCPSDTTKVLAQIATYGRWRPNGQLLDSNRNRQRREIKMTKYSRRKNRKLGDRLRQERGVIAVLRRAATESDFWPLAENPHEALKEYYSLTSEEAAALASGDIKKIESWVGKLDEKLATWLWSRLAQEKW